MNTNAATMSAFLNKLKHSEKSSTDEPLNSKGPLTTLGARVVNPEATDVLLEYASAGDIYMRTLNLQWLSIVFVHGLTGDRERTWTAAQASKCWPELLLTQDLPQARIIMYGYDADVVNFWNPASQNRIADHSQKLLTSLANLRERTGPRDRPLLFVAHSLGGLVVEDALLHARGSADAHTQRVLECARGVVFLGTPHCGAGLAAWAVVGSRLLRLLGKPVNQSTLEALRPQSEVMARIRRDFHTMLRAREEQRKPAIAIVCFFEELVTPALGEKVGCRVAAQAHFGRVVVLGPTNGSSSPIIGRTRRIRQTRPLHVDVHPHRPQQHDQVRERRQCRLPERCCCA